MQFNHQKILKDAFYYQARNLLERVNFESYKRFYDVMEANEKEISIGIELHHPDDNHDSDTPLKRIFDSLDMDSSWSGYLLQPRLLFVGGIRYVLSFRNSGEMTAVPCKDS